MVPARSAGGPATLHVCVWVESAGSDRKAGTVECIECSPTSSALVPPHGSGAFHSSLVVSPASVTSASTIAR